MRTKATQLLKTTRKRTKIEEINKNLRDRLIQSSRAKNVNKLPKGTNGKFEIPRAFASSSKKIFEFFQA